MLSVDLLKFCVLTDSDYKGNVTTAGRRFVATICEDIRNKMEKKVTSDRATRKAENQRPT
jgi:hypothetical protein